MNPEEIVPLVTERLILRPVEIRDAAAIHGFRGDPEATRYLSHGPLTAEANRERLEGVVALRAASTSQWFNYGWAITLGASGEVVGDARTWNSTVLTAAGVLSPGKHPFQHAVLGYILHPDHHHHGYGREAAGALVNWLFAERGITTVVAGAYEPNTPSIRLLRSLGFKQDPAVPSGPGLNRQGLPDADVPPGQSGPITRAEPDLRRAASCPPARNPPARTPCVASPITSNGIRTVSFVRGSALTQGTCVPSAASWRAPGIQPRASSPESPPEASIANITTGFAATSHTIRSV